MTLQFFRKNLLYLALASFVFVSSTSLALTKVERHTGFTYGLSDKSFAPRPVLSETINSFPVISAQSVLAVDLDSGVTLYEKDPERPLLPASTTKIVTALTAMDYYSPNSVLTVNGINVEGQNMGLVEGEKISFIDLLHGLLVFSANDAAEVIAANYPGGRDTFVAAMNLKAKSLGLTSTRFANPSGLEDFGHVSTAEDLVRVSAYAMRNPTFARIVATKDITVESENGKIKHRLANINELIGEIEGVKGVKTGWTQNARENLVTYVEKDGKRVMIALLGSQDRFGETKVLIEWIFENYDWEPVRVSAPVILRNTLQ